jgi:hypothetical protein
MKCGGSTVPHSVRTSACADSPTTSVWDGWPPLHFRRLAVLQMEFSCWPPLRFRRLAVLQMDFSCGLKPPVLTTILALSLTSVPRERRHKGATTEASPGHVDARTSVDTKGLQQRPRPTMCRPPSSQGRYNRGLARPCRCSNERRHKGATTKTSPNNVSTTVVTKALQQRPRQAMSMLERASKQRGYMYN